MKNFAIIGFGGLGKTHFLNLLKLQEEWGDISLKAICNDTLDTITKKVSLNITSFSLDDIDFSKYNLYTDYKEMVEKENLDFAFVTLPTYLHSEVCIYLLNHGINTMVEKPMALNLEQCTKMIEAAEKNNVKLMVGHSSRFCSEYQYLKEIIKNETYGKPIKAEFARKSPLPDWSFDNWMLDEKKSGGCIVDMHVHDVDMLQYLFGTPESIQVLSTNHMSEYESSYSLFKYPDMIASIITDWGIHRSYKFKCMYAVTFEKAYVECIDREVTVYTDKEATNVKLETADQLFLEEKEFIEAVVDGKPFKTADVYSVFESMKILFKEKDLLKRGEIK